MATPKAPKGGFKQGGWYEGRQYWGGTFSAPDQIHPSSSQQGAGQAVSKEVVAQTDPANVGYLAQQGAALPQSPDEVGSYLNKLQNQAFDFATMPELKTESLEEIRSQIQPEGDRPALIDYEAEFEALRTEHGVASLENSLNQLKAQEREIDATLRKRRATERGKRVPMGVIQGRITETERQERENLEYIGRRKQRVVDELNTSYKIIGQYMDFKKMSYEDATERYNTDFEQNMSLYKALQAEEEQAWDRFTHQEASARSNLQIYLNAMTEGNLNYNDLSMDQKVMISKLEAQAGMPIGISARIGPSLEDRILFTTTSGGVTQVGFANKDGTVTTRKYGTPTSGGGTTSERKEERERTAYKEMDEILQKLGGGDNIVSGQQWNKARGTWGQQGYDVDDFDDAFGQYTNTEWDTYTGISD